MTVSLHQIPLEEIAVLDRGRKDLGDIDALAESMRVNGQLQPGIVRPATEHDEDEGVDPAETPWVLVAGERRYRACAKAGLETYMAINKGELPPLEQKIYELQENLDRKEMEWYEQAALRRQIHELRSRIALAKGQTWTMADTARELGEHTSTISRDIQVAAEIEKDPSLIAAGSKKSAVRVLEAREHLKRETLRLQQTTSAKAKLSELIVHADARDWLRSLDTGSVNACISDFPYGKDFHSLAKLDQSQDQSSEYDDSEAVSLDLFADVVPQLIRVTMDTGWIAVFMCESNYQFLRDLFETCCTVHYEYGALKYKQYPSGDWMKVQPTQCPKGTRKDPCSFLRAEVPGWLWFRPNSRNPSRVPELHAKNFYEPILVFNRGAGKLYKGQDNCPNVLVHDAEYGDERIHSMQKPRSLARDLAERFTLPSQTVVDPFAGSGNLLAGAAELQRRVKGCELNPLMVPQAVANVSKYFGG